MTNFGIRIDLKMFFIDNEVSLPVEIPSVRDNLSCTVLTESDWTTNAPKPISGESHSG
jgi:hypothetical protein